MAAVIKEEKRIAPVKTYLERYQEYLGGYKQYKATKAVPRTMQKNTSTKK